MLTAYDEGFLAAEKGRSTTWCPHDEGDPRRDQWLKGWQVGVVTKRQHGQHPGSVPVTPLPAASAVFEDERSPGH